MELNKRIEELEQVMLKRFDELSDNNVTKEDFRTLKNQITKVSSQLDEINNKVFCKENSVRNRVVSLERSVQGAKKVVMWIAGIISAIISFVVAFVIKNTF